MWATTVINYDLVIIPLDLTQIKHFNILQFKRNIILSKRFRVLNFQYHKNGQKALDIPHLKNYYKERQRTYQTHCSQLSCQELEVERENMKITVLGNHV